MRRVKMTIRLFGDFGRAPNGQSAKQDWTNPFRARVTNYKKLLSVTARRARTDEKERDVEDNREEGGKERDLGDKVSVVAGVRQCILILRSLSTVSSSLSARGRAQPTACRMPAGSLRWGTPRPTRRHKQRRLPASQCRLAFSLAYTGLHSTKWVVE